MRSQRPALDARVAWTVVAVGGIAAVAAFVTAWLPLSAGAAAVAFVVGVAAAVVRRPARPWAWSLLLLGAAMVVFGRTSFALGAEPLLVAGRFEVGDIRRVVFYVALTLGLVLIGGRAARRDLADLLDATIVALGVFLLMWLFLLSGELTARTDGIITPFARPIGLAALAGALSRLLFVVERRTPSFRFLVAAIVFALAGAFCSIGQEAGYAFANRLDDTGIWYVAFTVLLAAAVLHPSSVAPLATRQGAESRFSTARAAVFVVLTLLGPLAWVVAILPTAFNPETVREFGLPVITTALITLLLLWRLALINRLADRRANHLEALRNELVYRATHDPLTGLSNRSELTSRLDRLVTQHADGGRRPALLLLDLDGFKRINDSFGHPVGDELLVEVGRRLSALAPPESTVVRLGGDEFAILYPEADERSALALAEVVRERLGQGYVTSRGPLQVSASVGVCVAPRVERSASEVLRDADLALYAAKAAGKNRVRSFAKTGNAPHPNTR